MWICLKIGYPQIRYHFPAKPDWNDIIYIYIYVYITRSCPARRNSTLSRDKPELRQFNSCNKKNHASRSHVRRWAWSVSCHWKMTICVYVVYAYVCIYIYYIYHILWIQDIYHIISLKKYHVCVYIYIMYVYVYIAYAWHHVYTVCHIYIYAYISYIYMHTHTQLQIS